MDVESDELIGILERDRRLDDIAAIDQTRRADDGFSRRAGAEGPLRVDGDMVVDSAGNVWTVEGVGGFMARVQKFGPGGQFISKFGSHGAENGQLNGPEALAIDAQGDVWVADTNNNRVQQFKPSGEFISKFGSAGSEEGQLTRPRGIAVDSEGNVWVSDSGNNRIQGFSAAGAYLSQFGSTGNDSGEFAEPKGVAVDGEGRIWVADTGNDRVQGSTGSEPVNHFGGTGSGPGNLSAPSDAAVDSEGNVWVADTNHHRIQVFSSSGGFVPSPTISISPNTAISRPSGRAVMGRDCRMKINNRLTVACARV